MCDKDYNICEMLMAPSSTVLIPKPQPLMCSNKIVVRNDAGWKKEVTRIYRKSFVHPPVKQSTSPASLDCQSSWFGGNCTKLPQKST